MGLFIKKKKSEIVFDETQTGVMTVENCLKDEYGIIIKPCNSLDILNSNKHIFIKDGAAKLSPIIGELPNQVTNALNYKSLSQNMYSVTFNGRDVLPSELYQKKNGNYISNLKSGSSWGSQTDLTMVDHKQVQLANVANATFGLASVATSTYYLKNIDDKLGAVVESTENIQNFLENDKQSKIQSAFEELQDIIDCILIIKENDSLKAMKATQVASIQSEQRSNIKFYEAEINRLLQKYISDVKKGISTEKLVEAIRRNYYYYQISMETYSVSKLVEIELTDAYNMEYVRGVKADFIDNSKAQILLHDKILDDIFTTRISKMSSKIGLFTSDILSIMGEGLEGKKMGNIELDKVLEDKAFNIKKNIRRKSLKHAYKILDEKSFNVAGEKTVSSISDFRFMEHYVTMIESMEATYSNPMVMVCDGTDIYLEITTSISEGEE